jgi:N-hydroxyarylamine O-acetyltransferase
MDSERVRRYLAHIGADAGPPTVPNLADLQLRHLLTVPFENLSVHLDEPIILADTALVDKIIRRHRGGFCYELNGAFAALLTALGYTVTRYAARVVTPAGPGPLFDHLALRVDLAGEPWLVDVGFGRFAHHPVRLDSRDEQDDPGGTVRVDEGDHGDLTIHRDGRPEYIVEPRPRELRDFEPTCWWHRTSPKSHFTRSLVCSRLTGTGRITLSDHTLITTGAGAKEERTLTDDEVLATYREQFGITLDTVPRLRQQ